MKTPFLYKLYKGRKAVAYIREDGVYYYKPTDIDVYGIEGYLHTLREAILQGYVDLLGFRRGLPPGYMLEVANGGSPR